MLIGTNRHFGEYPQVNVINLRGLQPDAHMLKSKSISSSPGCDSIRETNHWAGRIKLLFIPFGNKSH